MLSETIPETQLGPKVVMDPEGSLSFHGKSMMEDASLYYQPCHKWIADYIVGVGKPLTVTMELNYFNSSSAKQLLKLLMSIDESEIESKVIWIYPADNDVLLERGQEFEVMLNMPFEYQGKS